MKTLATITALAGMFLSQLSAQTNNAITVFSEGGERFYLIVNGVKQNTTAETNVKATGLNGQQVKAKVIFDQKGIADADKTIPMMWEGNAVSNTEFTFSISKDKKGNYKWKYVSHGPFVAAATAAITPASNNTVNVNSDVNTNTNNNSNTTVTTSTTTVNGGTAGANIQLGVNGVGMNVSMNVNDGMGATSTSTTTTTSSTVTTTTYSSTNGGNTSTTTNSSTSTGNAGNGSVTISMNTPGTVNNTTTTSTSTNTNVGTTTGACAMPMGEGDFVDAQRAIESKNFEDTKLTMAKQIADNNCLSSQQIRDIMKQFGFEDSRLEYAKYCYTRCYDKKNYYKVNDAFQFETSTDELNEYIKGK